MNVYSVEQVNAYIGKMFKQDFLLQDLQVQGEVSNLKYHSSGHIYFSLKDRSGTIACVMFAGNRSGLAFRMQDGQSVIVSGRIEVYERTGAYQLYASRIKLAGIGDLHEKFEALKAKLLEQGLFDPMYKQPIPDYCRTLGIVTAPTGAAVQDIIQITRRRNPYTQIILYPAQVQGEGAAESVVKGIRTLERAGVDVMIVGRGGGSLEDLWAFNEEIVAQAVFDCSVPIISAVGHETDTTIIDFVSDLRAPTPSAAAELAVPDVKDLLERIAYGRSLLRRHMDRRIALDRKQCADLQKRLQLLSPGSKVREHRNTSARLEEQLRQLMQEKIKTAKLRRERLQDRLQADMDKNLTKGKHRLMVYTERMKGLSPLEKLSQGYSYVADKEGKNVRSLQKVSIGETLKIYVTDGQIEAAVTALHPETQEPDPE